MCYAAAAVDVPISGDGDSSNSNQSALIGGIVGGILGLLILVAIIIIIIFCRKCKYRQIFRYPFVLERKIRDRESLFTITKQKT